MINQKEQELFRLKKQQINKNAPVLEFDKVEEITEKKKKHLQKMPKDFKTKYKNSAGSEN